MSKIALIFPGQGSHYIGMGKSIYRDYRVVKSVFEEAGEIVGIDMAKLCFEGGGELHKIENALLATFLISYSAFQVYWQEVGIMPMLTAGHSLGEITALTCAGAIDFQDALRLVRTRALLAQQSNAARNGSMLIVEAPNVKQLIKDCEEIAGVLPTVFLACCNSDNQLVLSGLTESLLKVEDHVVENGGKVTPLLFSPPFHSPLMKEAARLFETELYKISYKPLKWPVLSNVDASPYRGEEMIVTNLVNQLIGTVRWEETMHSMNLQADLIIELGPQSLLSDLSRKMIPSRKLIVFDHLERKAQMLEKVRSVSEHVTASKSSGKLLIDRCISIAVCLMNRNDDVEQYRLRFVEPYERIQQLKFMLEEQQEEATFEQMEMALFMLQSAFTAKKVPIEEREKRMEQLLSDPYISGVFAERKGEIIGSVSD